MTNFMPQSDSRNDPAFKSLEESRLGPADQKRLTFTDINDWVNITLKQHFRKDVKKVRGLKFSLRNNFMITYGIVKITLYFRNF